MKAPTEGDVLKAVMQLLTLRRIPHWRQNAGRLRVERGGRTHFYAFASAEGIADVIGLLPPSGRLLAIECKRPGGKPTPAQRGFLDAVAAAGGLALVVSDVRQLMEVLDQP